MPIDMPYTLGQIKRGRGRGRERERKRWRERGGRSDCTQSVISKVPSSVKKTKRDKNVLSMDRVF
jgi:hypothetical protein